MVANSINDHDQHCDQCEQLIPAGAQVWEDGEMMVTLCIHCIEANTWAEDEYRAEERRTAVPALVDGISLVFENLGYSLAGLKVQR